MDELQRRLLVAVRQAVHQFPGLFLALQGLHVCEAGHSRKTARPCVRAAQERTVEETPAQEERLQ